MTATSRDSNVASADVAGAAEVTVTGLSVGSTRIELTATDRAGLTASHLFDVTVSANRAPIAQSAAFQAALPENNELLLRGGTVDVPLTGLFVDPDGDVIDVSVSTIDDSILLVTMSGDVAVLVPRGVGRTDLIFNAVDSAANETTEIHTIHVVNQLTSSNQHPVLDQAALDRALPADRKMVVNSFHNMMIAGIFSDPEGGTLNIRLSSSNADVLQIQKSGDTTVRLFAIGEGTADLTITATDEGDLEAEAKVSIQVVGERPVTGNQAPVLDANAFAQALPPDRSIILQRFHRMDLRDLFTDPDMDPISLSAESSDASILRVSLSSGGTSAFLIARAIGSAELTITATDSQGNSTPAVATIKVIEQDANRAPEIDQDGLTAALPSNNTLSEGEFFELRLDELFSDPDGNNDIVALEGSSSNLDVLDVSVDDTNLLTALALSQGTAVLSLVARDKAGAEATVSVTITVTAASAASLAIGSQTLDRSAPLALELDELTSHSHTRSLVHDLQSRVGDPSILTSSVVGSTLTLHALKQGRTFVKLFNSDTGETAIRSMFYVDVVNAPPTLVASLSDQSATRVEGLSIDLHGAFEDADGEAIEISVRALDDSIIALTYEAGTLAIQGLQVGQTAVTVRAVDIHGAATETTFNVTIDNVAPALRSQVGKIQLQVGGEPYHLDFNEVFTDDGDALSYTIALDTLNIVQPDASATGVTYTPLTRGTVGLTVTAMDPYGGHASFGTTIIVGDERLREVAEKSLAGFGRAMLSSVSAAIGNRANLERVNSDLSNDSWRPAARAELDGGIRPRSASRNAASDAMASSSLWTSYLNDENRFDTSASRSFSPIRNGFSINLGSGEKTSPWSVWSNTDRQMYAGDAYDGTVTNTYLGVDKTIGDAWVMGLSVAKHRGESAYSYGTASQRLDLDLTQLLPYARYSPSDRTSMWGTLGVGRGELGTTVTGADDASSKLASHLAMLGARQHIASLMEIDLALRGEVAEASLKSAAGKSGSAGLSANVQRARVGIEGSYATNWFNDVAITPFGQLNLRIDRGDGDPGSGVEFTGGVKVDLRSVSVEMVGHTFEMRGQQPYRESGLQMTASVNPSDGGSGFSASITPRWGAVAQADGAVWSDFSASARTRHGNSPHQHPVDEPRMQLDSQLGYGFLLANEGLLLTPFVQYAQSGSDRQQAQLGAQLQKATRGTSSFSSRIGIGRVTTANKQDETSIGASFQMTF